MFVLVIKEEPAGKDMYVSTVLHQTFFRYI